MSECMSKNPSKWTEADAEEWLEITKPASADEVSMIERFMSGDTEGMDFHDSYCGDILRQEIRRLHALRWDAARTGVR